MWQKSATRFVKKSPKWQKSATRCGKKSPKGFQGVPRYGSATPGDLRAGTLRVRGARLPAEGRQASYYHINYMINNYIGNSVLRIIGANLEDPDAFDRLKKMRPRPSNYIAWGSTQQLQEIYDKAKNKDMIKRDSKWTLVSTDFGGNKLKQESLTDLATIITMTDDTCCPLLDKSDSMYYNINLLM